MDFIFFVDRFPDLDKKSIDQGVIPTTAIALANYFRSVFLLSNDIRKNNNIFIYAVNQFPSTNESLIIGFHGKKLRFLSPDERTTLLLFNNILKIAQGNTHKKLDQRAVRQFRNGEFSQSTPGVRFKKGKINDLFQELIKYREELSTTEKFINQNKSTIVFFDHEQDTSSNTLISDLKTFFDTNKIVPMKNETQLVEIVPLVDDNAILVDFLFLDDQIIKLNDKEKEEFISFIINNCNLLVRHADPEIDRGLFPSEQILVLESLLDNRVRH
jgi:hypothetical protein